MEKNSEQKGEGRLCSSDVHMIKENNVRDNPADVICGRNPVIEALKSGAQLDTIYIDGSGGSLNVIRRLAKEKGIVVKDADDRKLTRLAGGASHQGVVAEGACGEYVSVEDILAVSQNKGTKDEQHTIDANHAVLSLFNCTDDFPDGYVHDLYLGFTKMLENSLGIGEVGKSTKGLHLFKRFKAAVGDGTQIPQWAALIGAKLDALPSEASSILLEPQAEVYPWDSDYDIPF